MILFAIEKEMYAPIATIVSSIIVTIGVVFKAIYETRQKTPLLPHMPNTPPQRKRRRISFETLVPVVFLPLSVWQLVVLLRDASPVTRLSVFGIAALTGIAFGCIVYFTARLVMFVLTRRVLSRRP